MELNIASDPAPLRADAGGVIRVGKSRVVLDLVVLHFEAGDRPEEIVEQFPSLGLADVYGAIAYYLRHKQEVRAYLEKRRSEADRLREEIERRFPPDGVRERLLARRAAAE